MNIPSISSVLDAKSDIHLLDKISVFLLFAPDQTRQNGGRSSGSKLFANFDSRFERETERERERDCMKLAHKYFVLAAVVS